MRLTQIIKMNEKNLYRTETLSNKWFSAEQPHNAWLS